MDVEGAEKSVMEGMRKLNEKSPQLKMIIEFNPVLMRQAKVTTNELFRQCQALGFNRFELISDDSRRKCLPELKMPDDITHLDESINNGVVNILCTKKPGLDKGQ